MLGFDIAGDRVEIRPRIRVVVLILVGKEEALERGRRALRHRRDDLNRFGAMARIEIPVKGAHIVFEEVD